MVIMPPSQTKPGIPPNYSIHWVVKIARDDSANEIYLYKTKQEVSNHLGITLNQVFYLATQHLRHHKSRAAKVMALLQRFQIVRVTNITDLMKALVQFHGLHAVSKEQYEMASLDEDGMCTSCGWGCHEPQSHIEYAALGCTHLNTNYTEIQQTNMMI